MKLDVSSIWDLKNIHFYRQALATLTSSIFNVNVGVTFGFSVVLLSETVREETFSVGKGYVSWMVSVAPLSMIAGSLLGGYFMEVFGRRSINIVLAILSVIGWILLGFASNVELLIAGRVINGSIAGGIRQVSMIYVGETVNPKHRATSLFCISLAFHGGILYCHIISKYIDWRLNAWLCCVPAIICLVLFTFLKESPLWLISSGKVSEGVQTFNWYRGESLEDRTELKTILEKEATKIRKSATKDMYTVLLSKRFLKPFVTLLLLFSAAQCCGVDNMTIYAREILKNTVYGTVDDFIMMIIVDVVRIISVLIICFLANVLPRKTLFFILSFGTILCLFSLGVFVRFKPIGLVWLLVACLVAYTGTASSMVSVTWSFSSELFPSNIRGLASGITTAVHFFYLYVMVQITPILLDSVGMEYLYYGFAIMTLLLSLITLSILPETNGRSLQDIENSYETNNNSNFLG